MAAVVTCPDVQMLEQFFLGHIPEPQLGEVIRHIDGCSPCLTALQTLQPVDTLAQTAAALGQIADPGSDVLVQNLMHKLRQCAAERTMEPGQSAASIFKDVHATADSSNPAQHIEPGGSQLDIHFLAPPQQPDELGRLGSYRVLRVLGHGGMGVVFKAEDTKLQRLVALKAMKPSIAATANAGKRFLREARTMAAVKHDHIATIYQVDEDRGVPYLAMEFLDGEPLEARLRREPRLPIPEVLRIGREIALGLAAAHSRGLIHRDIKPGNVWLESGAGRLAWHGFPKPCVESGGLGNPPHAESLPRVKILDFGLARGDSSAESQITQHGIIVGTPAYMAPEQSKGEAVDARADLFSLGCVLYLMTTGHLPFRGVDAISTLLAVSLEQPQPPHLLNFDMPAALSDLILKLLAKKPEERCQTAHAVVEALAQIERAESPSRARQRAKEPQPVAVAGAKTLRAAARPPRRRWLVAAAVLLIAATGVFFGVQQLTFPTPDGTFLVKIDNKEVEARFQEGTLQLLGPDGKVKYTLKPSERNKTLPPGQYKIAVVGADGLTVDVDQFTMKKGDKQTVTVLFKAKEPQPIPGDPLPPIKGGEPLSPVCLVNKPAEIKGLQSWTIETVGHRFDVNQVSYSPDGKWLVSADDTGMHRCWDPADAYALKQILVGPADVIHALAWGPDKKTLAVARHTGAVDLWDVSAGRKLRTLKANAPVMSLSWTPDGQSLAAGCQGDDKGDPTLVWNPATSEVRHKKMLGAQVAYSPDGQTLAACDTKGKVRFYKAATLEHQCDAQQKWSGHLGARPLVWLPKQNIVIFGDWRPVDGNVGPYSILGFEASTGNTEFEVDSVRVNEAGPVRYALSSDGKMLFHTLITGDGNSAGCIQLDLPNKKPLGRTQMVSGAGRSVTCSPDGLTLAVGKGTMNVNADGIALFELASDKLRRELSAAAHRFPLTALTWSGDAKQLCIAVGGTWEAETGRVHPIGTFTGSGWDEPEPLSVAPDGMSRVVYTGQQRPQIQARENTDGPFKTMVPLLDAHSWEFPCSWSRDSRTLVHADKNKLVFREARTGKVIREHTLKEPIADLDLSPDGKTVIAKTGAFLEWVKADSGEILDRLRFEEVTRVAYSPDGKKLALGLTDGHVEIRTENMAKTLLRFKAHIPGTYGAFAVPGVNAIGWSPDGRVLGTAGSDARIRLWDAATGQPRAMLVPLVDQKGLALTADGHYRGTPERIERDLRYVAQLADGSQVTLTPEEFEKRFGWKNDPEKVRLTGK